MSKKSNAAVIDNATAAAAQRKRRTKADPMAKHVTAIVAANANVTAVRNMAEDARLDLAIAAAEAEAAMGDSKAFKAWLEEKHATVDGFPKPLTVTFDLQWGRIALKEGRDKAKAALDKRRADDAERRRKAREEAAAAAAAADDGDGDGDGERTPHRNLPTADRAIAALRAIKKKDDRAAAVREVIGDTHVCITKEQATKFAKGSPSTAADLFAAWQGLSATDRAAAFGMIAAAMSSVLSGTK